ncbi:MAG: hypothetical protein AAFU83_01580 [Bacteroidota bacterium]
MSENSSSTEASYRYYLQWQYAVKDTATLPYVPQSAALVYEVASVGVAWATWQETVVAQELAVLPCFQSMQSRWTWLKQLTEDHTLLGEMPFAVSIHSMGEDQVDGIFYLQTSPRHPQQGLQQLLSHTASRAQARHIEKRKYKDYTIITFRTETSDCQLHAIQHGPHVMISTSSLLIEDIIRGIRQKTPTTFLTVRRSANKQGSLYIHFPTLGQLLRHFLKSEYAQQVGARVQAFASAGQLELNMSHQHLLLNGFVKRTSTTHPYGLQTLTEQDPGGATLATYIPKSAAWVQHISVRDLDTAQAAYRQATADDQVTLGPALDHLLQGEFSLCTLSDTTQLLFVQVQHTEACKVAFEEYGLLQKPLAKQAHQLATIYSIQPDAISPWLPEKLFPNFQPRYMSLLPGCLILANQLTALTILGKQYAAGDTWSHMQQHQTWASTALDKAHYRLWINIPQAWPLVRHACKPAWENHTEVWKRFAQASLQLVHEPQDPTECYLSLTLQHTDPAPTQAPPQESRSIEAIHRFQAEAPMITKPFVVKTHRSPLPYVLCQDALYQLYFLDNVGNLRWKKGLTAPITTDVIEVDFYNNGKIQYLFCTTDSLHVIDCQGKEINKYPQKLTTSGDVAGLRMVDYARDKNYRWLIVDTHGNHYLKDKEGKPLPGWNPKALKGALASTPLHIRIKLDYFLTLKQDGYLHALNRRGQPYPGFPVYLAQNTHNPLVVQPGHTVGRTRLVTLSDAGKYHIWSLSGDLQHSGQMERLATTTKFILCPNEANTPTYAIIRKDLDKIVVMDEAGDICFEQPYEVPEILLCQYYDWGTHRVYAITDPLQQHTYLYDRNGAKLHTTPLDNSGALALDILEDQMHVKAHVSHKDTYSQYILPICGSGHDNQVSDPAVAFADIVPETV